MRRKFKLGIFSLVYSLDVYCWFLRHSLSNMCLERGSWYLTAVAQFHTPSFLFRGLQVFRTFATRAGKHGIHQTVNSQLFAQHLPKTLPRRRENTKRYVWALVLCWRGRAEDLSTSSRTVPATQRLLLLTTLDVLDEEKFNVELIVQCIRVSEMPQTHHHALLLLGTVAGIFPVSTSGRGRQQTLLLSVDTHGCSLFGASGLGVSRWGGLPAPPLTS